MTSIDMNEFKKLLSIVELQHSIIKEHANTWNPKERKTLEEIAKQISELKEHFKKQKDT